RATTVQAQLATLEAELLDAETYVALAESLEGFLAKLHDAAQSLEVADRQRVLRLVVKEVRVAPDSIVIKHSIPVPGHHTTPGYLLRPGDRERADWGSWGARSDAGRPTSCRSSTDFEG